MNPNGIGREVWLLACDYLELREWDERDPRAILFKKKWHDITRAIDLLAHSAATPEPSVRGFVEVAEPTEERLGWEARFE